MTYNIVALNKLLKNTPHSLDEIIHVLDMMLKNGYSKDTLSSVLSTFCNVNDIDEEYEDDLDEISLAMHGHCHSSCVLHPENYKDLVA